jgi:selenocysteine lyase/cysteine desulfurase
MTDARFLVPPGGPYLLAHSVGCQPLTARAALERHMLEPWATRGGEAWPDWLSAIGGFREALARLLGGQATDYCPQPNLSAGLFAVLSALPRRPGRDVILASAHTFPSLGFAAQQMERLSYRFVLIPEDRNPGEYETWDAALTESVALVLVMHVHSNTGVVAPVAEIAAQARVRGIFSVIDVAQSAGILPIDVNTWGADAIIGSCVKWLCGGPGAGFLWIDPEKIETLAPMPVGWFSHAEPFAFDIRDFRYAPDARRFWGGTPSIAPYALATAGIDLITDMGVDAVLAHNRALIARVAGHSPEAWQAPFDREGRGGTICLQPRSAIDTVVKRLSQGGCRFDRRGDTLRLSFHLWNTTDDADRVAACLRS